MTYLTQNNAWRRCGAALATITLATILPAQTVLCSQTGQLPGDRFGGRVASAGDFDGDGTLDWIAGADQTSGALGLGYAKVISGRTCGTLATLLGPGLFASFGNSVSGAGDVNRDGFADVVVGAPSHNNRSGAVFVYFGGPKGGPATGALAATLPGKTASQQLGLAVCGVGDVDGDGHGDFAASGRDTLAPSVPGIVVVFSGRTMQVIHQVTRNGSTRFGESMACLGDTNGNGTPDLAVGLPGVDRVEIFDLGPGMPRLRTLAGPSGDFGSSVGGAGDVDGDNAGDVIVGAFAATAPASWPAAAKPMAGAVAVYSGRSGAQLMVRYGTSAYDHYGNSVAAAGDVDRDGFDDVLIGTLQRTTRGAGYIEIVSLRKSQQLYFLAGQNPGDFQGEVGGVLRPGVTTSGDIDNNGTPDFLLGAHGVGGLAGRAQVIGVDRATVDSHGNACGGLNLAANGPPRVGRTLELTLSGAAPFAPGAWLFGNKQTSIPIPFSVSPSCVLLNNSSVVGLFAADASGVAVVSLLVPPLPRLMGTSFFAQALAGQPTGFASTQGLQLRIGLQ